MEASEIIAEQISAAIAALTQARDMLNSRDIDEQLDIAAFHISDIQFNVNSLRFFESIQPEGNSIN